MSITDLARSARSALIGMAALAIAAMSSSARAAVSDPRFAEDTLYSGAGMVSIEFGPGGRMYVCEKRGRVLVFQPDGAGRFRAPTVFLDMRNEVFANAEAGLLGMRLDPSFATNRFVYLFHSATGDQRLIRVTADSTYNLAVAGSRQVLLSGLPRQAEYHKAGDIQFHPQDANSLYVALGDDGQRSLAQNLDRYHGKILRVNKSNGQGLSDNPFASGVSLDSVRARVWAYGLRNPFRITFHPNTPSANVVYISENGDDRDRVSRVTRGSNGSWSSAGDGGGFLAPPDAGHRVMALENPSLTGIVIARGGGFADSAGADVLLLGNGRSGIKRFRLSGANLDQLQPLDGGRPFVTNLGFAAAVDLAIGPDGALYFTQTGGGASDSGFTLRRVRTTGAAAGSTPVASFTTSPSPAQGLAPLTVTFTDRSTDSDGSVASWAWNFGDGSMSSERNPTHRYTASGVFTASLTVTDNSSRTSAQPATATVTTGRTLSLTLTGRVYDARRYPAANMPGPTELRLYDGDPTRPLAFPGGTSFRNNAIVVQTGGTFNRTITIQPTSDRLIVSAGEVPGDGMHAAYRGFTVPLSATAHTQQLTYYLSSTAVRGRVSDTRGANAVIDIGVARGSMSGWYAFSGARDRRTTATGMMHRIDSDPFGFYYVPIRSADVGASFFFDLLADTNTSTYTGEPFAVAVSAQGALVVHDILVGLRAGGLVCDNLAAIPTTPNIDYATHIQPIWNASCTGCHAPTASNSGGLDLMPDSRDDLVNTVSNEVPGLLRVKPRDVAGSYLMEKINCADPQLGDRMRPTEAMTPAQQALIRDWILQLP